MKTRQIIKFWAYSLSIILLCYLPVHAQEVKNPLPEMPNSRSRSVRTRRPPPLRESQILRELGRADVVYLGENHDSFEDHQAQLEIIQQLTQKNGKVAIALEMFQRPFQKAIDDYLAGKITETQLVAQTEYQERWGFPWKYYAPILRFAKENNLPVLAINTPTEVTRKVARSGLEVLTPEDRQYIPPLTEIRTDNAAYRQMLLDVFQQHQAGGHGNSDRFERFFLAQVLWDETMAEAISQFIAANPDYQVVVLAGQGHIVCGHGIPTRVARRLNYRPLVQRSVLLRDEDLITYQSSPGCG
ncbi:MAG: ChaN family lipoprotein [Hormoscilla sp. GM102CHS1]|nr:ChaN family lipoprotein [Hormoscilla sp. GM102CHS1]